MLHRLIAVSMAALLACAAHAASAALPVTAAGAADPTFGGGSGRTVNALGTAYSYGKQVHVLADGKILVTGYGAEKGALDGLSFILRFNADGTPDLSFNQTGRRVFTDGTYLQTSITQPDGRILVAGSRGHYEGAKYVASGWLTRLLADGTPDPSFGTGGETIVAPQGGEMQLVRGIQPAGDAIVAAAMEYYSSGNYYRGVVLRFDRDGHPDTAFGTGGMLALSPVLPFIRIEAAGLSKLADGSFMWNGSGRFQPQEGRLFGIQIKLLPSGLVDTSFGDGGLRTVDNGASFGALRSTVELSDGRLLTNGYEQGATPVGLLQRTDAHGVADLSFGVGGTVVTAKATFDSAMTRQADGKLLLPMALRTPTDFDGRVARLLPTGEFDLSFGTGGFSASLGFPRSLMHSATATADGRITVSGTVGDGNSADMVLVARLIGAETTTPVVEFFNAALNHYFITADPNEAVAIDGGAAGPGWSRTGQTFRSGGPNRVCRFYGAPETDPATGRRRGPNSHFYTIDSGECTAVKEDAGWRFESYDFNGWPMAAGACPAGTQPVRRVYNGRFRENDSNHRYVTTDALYDQMIAQGWSGEGTVFCAPQ